MGTPAETESGRCCWVNGRVSSDVEELERLHARWPWIPGRENIRPTPAAKAAKEQYLAEVRTAWLSEGDYVLATVFGFPPTPCESDVPAHRLWVSDRETLPQRSVFDRNAFPYDLPRGTRHFVMWYTQEPPGGDAQITRDIAAALALRAGGRPVEFCFYTNPKKTISCVSHVQVFWHVVR